MSVSHSFFLYFPDFKNQLFPNGIKLGTEETPEINLEQRVGQKSKSTATAVCATINGCSPKRQQVSILFCFYPLGLVSDKTRCVRTPANKTDCTRCAHRRNSEEKTYNNFRKETIWKRDCRAFSCPRRTEFIWALKYTRIELMGMAGCQTVNRKQHLMDPRIETISNRMFLKSWLIFKFIVCFSVYLSSIYLCFFLPLLSWCGVQPVGVWEATRRIHAPFLIGSRWLVTWPVPRERIYQSFAALSRFTEERGKRTCLSLFYFFLKREDFFFFFFFLFFKRASFCLIKLLQSSRIRGRERSCVVVRRLWNITRSRERKKRKKKPPWQPKATRIWKAVVVISAGPTSRWWKSDVERESTTACPFLRALSSRTKPTVRTLLHSHDLRKRIFWSWQLCICGRWKRRKKSTCNSKNSSRNSPERKATKSTMTSNHIG